MILVRESVDSRWPRADHSGNVDLGRRCRGKPLDYGKPLKSQIGAGSLDMRPAVRRDQRVITTLRALVSAARAKVS